MNLDKHDGKPGRARRRQGGLLRVLFIALILVLVSALSIVSAAWTRREAVATRLARKALEQRGLTNFCFRVAHLSLSRLIVEDFALGSDDPLLSVEKVEASFTIGDLLRKHVGRVSLSGVSTRLVVDGALVTSPLYESIKPLLAASQKAQARRPKRAQAGLEFSVGAVVLSDILIDVELAGGTLLSEMVLDAGVVFEADDRYRFWFSAVDEQLLKFKADGHLTLNDGGITVMPEVSLSDLKRLYNIARLIAPDQVASFGVIPEKGGVLNARGVAKIRGWRELETFEIGAELGRGSAFKMPANEISARFQSARLEAGGSLQDFRCRLSTGLSAFSFKDTLHVERETGRLLGMRGSARWLQKEGGKTLNFTVESDLPGRSMSQILPGLLPLAPIFFSDGGTLSVNAGLECSEQEQWGGKVNFKAEATRSSAPLAAGRMGCGKASLSGVLDVNGGRAGNVLCELELADGYLIRRDVNARGDVKLALKAEPPYTAAAGAFSGRLKESIVLPRMGLVIDDGYVQFDGDVAVSELVTNPVWEASVRVPETGLTSEVAGGRFEARAGARASLRYGGEMLSVGGEAWLCDLSLRRDMEDGLSLEAGLGDVRAKLQVPPFELSAVSNMLVESVVSWSGGHFKTSGAQMALEDLEGEVNFGWSMIGGLSFDAGQRLLWRSLEAQGLRVLPGEFGLARIGEEVEALLAVKVEGCDGEVAIRATLPLADARRAVLHVTLPETELAADGVIAEAIRSRMPDFGVEGTVSAAAEIRFLGSQPYVTGRVKMRDGHLTSGDMAAEGVAADVAFESGVFFRTIERPAVTFKQARVGKLMLDAGRVEFHLTPKELFVDRLEVGWCKGRLNAYSVHLDFKNPQDDFIVYADRIDLGEALMMALSFKGQIEGYLYGRFPVGIDRGRVKLYNGFLYSLPGQSGKLRLDDSGQMLELLERAGIRGDVQEPLSKALSDMDFSSVRLDLETLERGQGVLRIKLGGKSNYKEWPAPVDLNLNLHGPMEELLNMGLDMSRKR
ncbi:MAG: YdbH domain-containing protein [Kiritimatiellae bacterium]|nr:YdbH domain-containing protein [Kiritimatiellia bacterium]